jgi:hypothetical protein
MFGAGVKKLEPEKAKDKQFLLLSIACLPPSELSQNPLLTGGWLSPWVLECIFSFCNDIQ